MDSITVFKIILESLLTPLRKDCDPQIENPLPTRNICVANICIKIFGSEKKNCKIWFQLRVNLREGGIRTDSYQKGEYINTRTKFNSWVVSKEKQTNGRTRGWIGKTSQTCGCFTHAVQTTHKSTPKWLQCEILCVIYWYFWGWNCAALFLMACMLACSYALANTLSIRTLILVNKSILNNVTEHLNVCIHLCRGF